METAAVPQQIDFDFSAINGKPCPMDFIAEHLCPQEMLERLGITADELWLGVRDGSILKPVYLPAHPPMAVWNEAVVEEWLRCGRPVDPTHWAHRALVLGKLVDSVRQTIEHMKPA